MRNIFKGYHERIAINVTLSAGTGGTAVFTPAALGPVYSLNSLPIGTQIQLVQIQGVDTYVFLHNGSEIGSLTITASSGYNFDSVVVNSTTVTSTPITLEDGDTINVAFCSPDYLGFTANTAGSTIKLAKNGSPTEVTLETSTDGNTWTTYTFGDTITLANVGDKVYWRNTSETTTGFSTSYKNYYQFVMTGSIAGGGDVNYILNKNSTTTLSGYCFMELFYQCTSLTEAPELPATTLADYCYSGMFNRCSGLTAIPALPATTVMPYCYQAMFANCTGLTTLPAFYIRQFVDGCCRYMFDGCSNIKLSETQTGEYVNEYRIPITGESVTINGPLLYMFRNTGGTFVGTPPNNTTFYTSNTIVS